MTAATAQAPSTLSLLLDLKRWKPVAIAACITLAFCLLFNHFFHFGRDMQVSGKRSTTNVLYLIPRWKVEPVVGTWVAFRSARMVAPFKDGMTVVKMLIAGPGDHVQLTNESLTVNGRFIQRNEFTRIGVEAGTPVDIQPMDVVLGPAQYFAIGTHPRSYDSRFWGILEGERIISRAFGLF